MKYAIVALILAFSVTEANAVIYCAVGVYRAGCVARPGVGVVHPRVVVCPVGWHLGAGGVCRRI